jgi:hypothetical protein
MKPKVPWLPAEVQPGQKTETCPRCGANKMIPWTLARDPKRVGLLRTWVCTACQFVEARADAVDSETRWGALPPSDASSEHRIAPAKPALERRLLRHAP